MSAKKLKRLDELIELWKKDNSEFPNIIATIKQEQIWNLVADSFDEFLELEFSIPKGSPFSVSTGKVVSF